MKKTIIIGASSGIGYELARILSQRGYIVGIMGRRKANLEQLYSSLPGKSLIKTIDVTSTAQAKSQLDALISEMRGVDLAIISAGIAYINPELEWEKEKRTIDTNVTGFTLISTILFRRFLNQGSGHLVGISSIAALRGSPDAPAYNASKSYISNYLQGLRKKAVKYGNTITVTDVQPGFVDTAMAKGDNLFWVSSPQKAAKQIFVAIEAKKSHVYITKRWRFIGWILKFIPDFLYNKIS